MGVRGEVFSTKVGLQNRTYFFNVKENRMGDLYLNIVESKNRDEGGFDRQSVILFAEDLQEFLRGFDESLKVLEKTVREKRRGASGKSSNASARFGRQDESGGRDAFARRERDGRERPGSDAPRRGERYEFHGSSRGGRDGEERRDDGKRRFKPRRTDSQGRGEDAPFRDRQKYKERDDKDRGAQAPRKKKVVVKKR